MKIRQSQLLRKVAIAGSAIALLACGLLGWRVRERNEFRKLLQARATARGASLHFGEAHDSMFGESIKRARFDLGSEVSITLERATLRQRLLAAPVLAVDSAHIVLNGSPAALWNRWATTAAWRDVPITFAQSTVEYRDPSVGHVSLANAKFERRGEELLVTASRLTFNGQPWNDVTLAIAQPKTTVRIGIGEATQPASQVELRYVPSQSNAAEWMLNIPSQSLGSLLERLGAGKAPQTDRSRVAGTLTAVVFDDATKPTRANLQLIIDHWFVPAWPEATAFTGRSGSIGAHLEPGPDANTWMLTRVEASAAIFSLKGKGTLTVGDPSRFTFVASGTRNCAQLAAHLPTSVYREQVRAYLERAKHSPTTPTNPEEQTVELRLSAELSLGTNGQKKFVWHLSAACGLAELHGEGALGGV